MEPREHTLWRQGRPQFTEKCRYRYANSPLLDLPITQVMVAAHYLRQPALPQVSRCGVTLLAGDREAELLPVPYFHVVYTLPSELRDIAHQNKGVVYNLLMKAAAETTLAIASDPKL